jgi:FeS assembly SUF system protein
MTEGTPGGMVAFTGQREFEAPIVEALKKVYDPEIPVDIYELGLIYKIDVDGEQKVRVEMTLTSPACPAAEMIPVEVKNVIEAIKGLGTTHVEIVWDPPWTPDFMSDAAKVQLGMY